MTALTLADRKRLVQEHSARLQCGDECRQERSIQVAEDENRPIHVDAEIDGHALEIHTSGLHALFERTRLRVEQREGILAAINGMHAPPVRRAPEAELREALRLAIHELCHPELLREPAKLAQRCGPLTQVHEMRAHPPFREEAERLPGFGVLLYADDLDFLVVNVADIVWVFQSAG